MERSDREGPLSASRHEKPAPRRWRWRLLVLSILAAGVGGFVALQAFKPEPAARAPGRQVPLVRVDLAQAASGPLSVVGHGVVRPRAEVAVGAELSGRVVHVSPDLVTGGRFGRGDVLVRLDAAPFAAALAQAEAERSSAGAALTLAEQTVRRTEDLIAQGFLSRQALDERIASRDQARAALARAEAQVHQRRLDLARTEIRAPFDGRVLAERVDVGDTAQPGRELARIYDARELEVAVSLGDREMALVGDAWGTRGRAGADRRSARVHVEHGGAEYRWPGRIDRVEAALDSATRTFSVIVRVLEPTARGEPLAGAGAAAAPPLVVGMFARVEIDGRDPGPHLRLPRAALRDGDVVWLLDAASAISIRPVRVLHQDDSSVAVTAEGIEPGAQVVVSALPVVTDGMPVRVAEPAAAAPK